MARTYHGLPRETQSRKGSCRAPAPRSCKLTRCRAPGLCSLVISGFMGGVVVTMMVLLGGKGRGGKHHHQENGGDDFLHGLTLAPTQFRGYDRNGVEV